jgi:hypothetical protein
MRSAALNRPTLLNKLTHLDHLGPKGGSVSMKVKDWQILGDLLGFHTPDDQAQAEIEAKTAPVKQFLLHLVAVEGTLGAYLEKFDQRAAGHFHLSPKRAVQAYYVLRNIEAALAQFLQFAAPVANGEALFGSEKFCRVDTAILEKFEYATNVMGGTKACIPFFEIETKIAQLETVLDEGFREVEDELNIVRRRAG